MKGNDGTLKVGAISRKLIKLGTIFTCLSAPLFISALSGETIKLPPVDTVYEGFVTPPDYTKPGTYWYWMNEEVTKEGITKDLEALYSKGIGEAYIGNIYWGGGSGTVPTLGDEWLECMRHAIREGSRIGINVSVFNCPGWSQSGGPWVKPEDAMRHLVYSEVEVEGPTTIEQYINKPRDFFQDVSVIAYPVLLEETVQKASIKSTTGADITNLTDENFQTICRFANKSGEPVQIDIKYGEPVTKRSLYIKPGDQSFHVNCDVLIKRDGKFVPVKSHYFDRVNREVRMGADPSAPLALSLGEVTSDEFRLILKDVPANFELRELDLSVNPILENYPEKWLIKIPSKATPDWFAHIWNDQKQPSNAGIVAEKQIQNISQHLKGDTIYWEVPEGKWKILRIGMTTTNTTNQPAAPVARGLEIDKMNKRPIESHYNAYVGRIVEGMSQEDLKAFNRVIADSYETGPQNWTDGFDTVFVERYGYDPYPWMAVLTGQIVGSVDESNRFLWDMRRLIAERVASEFVGGMKEVCEKNGRSLWLENYGWDGFPSEFILYSKYSPAIGGEFWTNHGDNIECRLASSGAHMYGKNKVYAESYTTMGNSYLHYPGNLKKFGDQAFAEGINQIIMHLCIHQPYDKAPGVNSWFGIEYNRNNTWFDQSKAWIDYQRRCGYMLQQGRHNADVCFFISEESPKMSGWVDQTLSKGYDYDFINSDVIENVVKVKDGRLVLPSGISYSLLVLPPLNTMRPEVLKRIKELVKQGANILGSPIERSPSMVGYPLCDREVQKLSKQIWGSADYKVKEKVERKVGKGMVFCNIPINTVLAKIGTPESVSFDFDTPILWKQRVLDEGNVYFLSNQKDTLMTVDIAFNSMGYLPELWNPVDGSRRKLDRFSYQDDKTIIPVTLDGYESCFIIFSEKGAMPTNSVKQQKERVVATLDDSWDIEFFNKWTNDKIELKQHGLENWAESKDDRIRHFSGHITYKNDFDIAESLPGKNVYLNFENLYEVASVSINGEQLERELWCKPFKIDIAPYLKQGNNRIEVKVSNSWRNKIIEQQTKPAEEREISYVSYSGDNELSPSGIWGKVCIKTM